MMRNMFTFLGTALMIAVLYVTLLTGCMRSEGETTGTSTSTPEYNEDTRTPEPQNRKGDYERTHIPNTGPDNDSDSMQ